MEQFTLIPVTSEDAALQTVLENLTKMYCCEWSQFTGMDVDESGRYIFEKYLPTYWEKPDRKAFLLRCGDKWAGFALIDRDFIVNKDSDYSLAEFFVLYKYRRMGAGKWMATTLFDRYRGKWELGRNPKNAASVSFWDKTVAEYTCGKYEYIHACPAHRYPDGTLGDVFLFNNIKKGDILCILTQ